MRKRRILVAKMWAFCQICKGLKDFDGNNRALDGIMLHFCYGICAINLIVENKQAERIGKKAVIAAKCSNRRTKIRHITPRRRAESEKTNSERNVEVHTANYFTVIRLLPRKLSPIGKKWT